MRGRPAPTVFVGGLPATADEDDLRRFFNPVARGRLSAHAAVFGNPGIPGPHGEQELTHPKMLRREHFVV